MEPRPNKTTRRSPSKSQATTARATSRQSVPPSHGEIAVRAHELFEQSGRHPGRDEQYWFEAERQLKGGLKLK